MRARVRKDDSQPTVQPPAVPWVLRAAATLPRGERVSNPLLGEDVADTYAVIDLAADEDATLEDARDLATLAKGALLVCTASDDDVRAAGFAPFHIEGCDLTFGVTYPLIEAGWITKAGKYDHIDFKPPAGVAAAAAKGLEFRRKGGGGGLTTSEASAQGIGSGVARAASLKNRQKQSPETVRRMAAFFSRHEKNSTIDPKYKSEPWRDRGYVAWLLWGGDPGRAWADKVVAQMNAADAKAEKAMPVLKPFAGFEDFDACVASMRAQGHNDESARAICGRLQADDPAHKADLAIAPGSAGALAPEQDDRLRRVRTKATNEVALIKVDAPDTDERYILGVVLEPDEVDSQGDTISAEEIRDAAHLYMQEHGNVGLQHQTFVNDKIKILESYIAPADFEIGGQKVKQGTWLMAFRVLDDSIWKAIKSGLLTGLSIGGTGLRMAVP